MSKVDNRLRIQLDAVDIGRIERIHALRSMFGPGDSPPTQALAALAQHIHPVRIPEGMHLTREGSLLGMVYLVIEGRLYTAREDRSWGDFSAPSSVGLLPALAGGMRGLVCYALEDTIALSLRAEDMLEVFEDHFELMHGVLKGFARGAIEHRRRIMPDAGFGGELRAATECPAGPLDLVERILYLRQSFALSRSFVTEIAEFARAADEARYAPGTRLWSMGDPARHGVILLCGRVECTSVDGARFAFGPGDIIGNLDTMAMLPRWFEATATEPTVALTLHREVLVDVLEDQTDLAFDFMRMLAATLIDLRERAHDLGAANRSERAAAQVEAGAR